MNQGAVASRYARAFLALVREGNRGEQVFAQARALLEDASAVPQPVEEDIQRLVLLLKRNRRTDCLRLILSDFVRFWCKEERILLATLTTAVPAPGLQEKLESLLADRSGCRVIMKTATDPELLGGFVLELEDETLDASVRRQIDDIRRQLVQKNNRII